MKALTKYTKALAEVQLWKDKLKAGYSPYKWQQLVKANKKLQLAEIEIKGIQTKLI